MKKASLSLLLLLILAFFSFGLIFPLFPVNAAPLSEPLVTATTPRILAIIPAYPPQLVSPRIYPTYKFLTNGGVYAWNNLGDNITISPSITGFSPAFKYNSSFFQYSATILGCTITVSYKVINTVNLKQTITGVGCPPGSYSFNLSNLNGFAPSLSGCKLTYKSIIYSWCDAVTSGITINYLNGKVSFVVTSANFSIDPSIVQKSGTTCSTPNCQKAFSPAPTSGNLLVAAVGIVDTTTTCGTATISDTQSNTYTSIASASKAGATNCFFTQMWYATAGSSSADTITVAYSRSLVDSASGIFIYELSGVTATGLTSSTGSGSGAPPTLATGSVSFSASAILIATLSIGEGTVGTMAAGTGFTLDQSASPNSNQESATSGITSPTTFPFSQSGNSGTQYFSEVGAQFPAQVTQPITCTMDNSGTQVTVTVSGGNISPTTKLCNGSSTNFTCDSGATITATEPADGSNTRARFSGGGTTTTVSCSTSAWTFTNYYQLQNTYQATPNAQSTWDSGLTAPNVVGTVAGTGSTTICSITLTGGGGAATCSGWGDYNRAAVVGGSTIAGAPANSQWERNGTCSFSQTTGGNTNNCGFYKEWTNSFLYSLTGGGSPTAPTLSCNKLGATATLALTLSAQSQYCDNGATATATNPTTGSTSTERFHNNGQSFSVTAGGATDTFAYYHQYFVTNPNSLSITPYQFGATVAAVTTDAWNDASQSVSVAATYTQSWTITYASWIYDVTASSIGIQLLGDQALSAITYNTNNPSAPFLAFTTASSGTEKALIPSASGLTISAVTNAGIANTGYTFASNILTETGASPHEVDFTSSSGSNPAPSGSTTPTEGGTTTSGGGGGGVLVLPPTPKLNITTPSPEVVAANQSTTNLGILLIILIVATGTLIGAVREENPNFRPPRISGGNPFKSVGGGGGDPFASPRRRKANWRRPKR